MSTATRSAPHTENLSDGKTISSLSWPGFRRNLLEAFAGVAYLLAWILLLEILFRIGHIGEQEYLKLDPVLGMTHLENKLVTDRSEAFAVSTINSVGNCDREHNQGRAPGVFRIAVLGDSMTEAIQVPNDERFCTLLERKLNSTSPGHFEVLNFGNGAFSTGQEYLQYLDKVQAYKPDLTVLMFHQGDQEKNAPIDAGWSLRPTFTVSHEGKVNARWMEFDKWRASPSALPLTLFDFGRRHSRIWGVLLQTQSDLKKDKNFKAISDRLFGILNACGKAIGANKTSTDSDKISSANVDSDVALERRRLCREGELGIDVGKLDLLQNQRIDKWNLTLTLIEKLNLACKTSGSKLFIASLPAFEGREEFKKHFNLIGALGTAGGFATKDLTPAFETAANQETNSLFLTGHLSARGHELVSDLLKQQVLTVLR